MALGRAYGACSEEGVRSFARGSELLDYPQMPLPRLGPQVKNNFPFPLAKLLTQL
jgi:hypothetical protein